MKLLKKSVSILLVFMLIVSIFTIVPISASAADAEDTITVFFTNAQNWTGDNIYVYWWDDSDNNEQWPGKAMTELYDNEYNQKVYAAEVPADIIGVIFNNNTGNQTVDITSGLAANAWWYTESTTNDQGRNNVGVVDTENYTYYPAVASTCTATGNVAYYKLGTVNNSDVFWNGKFGDDKVVNNDASSFVTAMKEHTYGEPTYAFNGNDNSYTKTSTCSVCGHQDVYRGYLDYVYESESSCSWDGNIAYWYDNSNDDCFILDEDNNLTPIEKSQTVIPATGNHNYEWVCDYNYDPSDGGSYNSYKICTDCYEEFDFGEGTIKANSYHPESTVTDGCTVTVNQAYLETEDGKYIVVDSYSGSGYTDGYGAPLKSNIEDVSYSYENHNMSSYEYYVRSANGGYELAYGCTCQKCGTQRVASVQAFTYVEAKAATCGTSGNDAYYYLDNKDKLSYSRYIGDYVIPNNQYGGVYMYLSTEGELISSYPYIEPTGEHDYESITQFTYDSFEEAYTYHQWEQCKDCGTRANDSTFKLYYVEYNAPTTETSGNIAHYYGNDGSSYHYFTKDDADNFTEITEAETVIPMLHQLVYVPVKAATTEAAGNIEYWYCSACGKYFSDAEGLNEIEENSWIIEPLTTIKHSLTLDDGNIGVSFYIPADATDIAASKDGSELATVMTSKDVDGVRYSKVQVRVAAAEMTKDITLTFNANGGKAYSDVYSVKRYGDTILADETRPAKLTNLVRAMLNYGAKAQLYFNVNTDNLANEGVDTADLDDITADDIDAPILDESVIDQILVNNGISHDDYELYRSSLVLNSETSLKFIFVRDINLVKEDLPSLRLGDTTVTTVHTNPQFFSIGKYDIRANELDRLYTLVYNDINLGEYSVMSAAKAALASASSAPEVRATMIALYYYNQFADEYFNTDIVG